MRTQLLRFVLGIFGILLYVMAAKRWLLGRPPEIKKRKWVYPSPAALSAH